MTNWPQLLRPYSKQLLRLADTVLALPVPYKEEWYGGEPLPAPSAQLLLLRRDRSIHAAMLTLFSRGYIAEAGLLLRAQIEGHAYSLSIGDDDDAAEQYHHHRKHHVPAGADRIVERIKRQFASAYLAPGLGAPAFVEELYRILSQIAHANPVAAERDLFYSWRWKPPRTRAAKWLLEKYGVGGKGGFRSQAKLVNQSVFHLESAFMLTSQCDLALSPLETATLRKLAARSQASRTDRRTDPSCFLSEQRRALQDVKRLHERLKQKRQVWKALVRSWKQIVSARRFRELAHAWIEIGMWSEEEAAEPR
jgi:hypothetical protein